MPGDTKDVVLEETAAEIAASRPQNVTVQTAGELLKAQLRDRLNRIVVDSERDAAIAARTAERAERIERENRSRLLKGFNAERGRRYGECALSNYRITSEQQAKQVQQVRIYIEQFNEQFAKGIGLTFIGPVGGGKDHLATAVCHHVIQQHGCAVVYVSGVRLYSQLRDAVGSLGKKRPSALIDRYRRASILYLADPVTGNEPLTRFQIESLTELIDGRYQDLRPTIVTANLAGGKEGERILTPPIVDRMRDSSVIIDCNWESYRAGHRPTLVEV